MNLFSNYALCSFLLVVVVILLNDCDFHNKNKIKNEKTEKNVIPQNIKQHFPGQGKKHKHL